MNDPHILEAAYICLLEQGWHSLPIDPMGFSLPGCWLLSYRQYASMAHVPLEKIAADLDWGDGYTIHARSGALLLYNDQAPAARRRFTVAHEIGHYLLGHTSQSQKHEAEANYFASVLLMPDALLRAARQRGCRLSDSLLMRSFGVSRAAACRKLQTLRLEPHPLDKQVQSLFYACLRTIAPVSSPGLLPEARLDPPD